MKIKLIPNTRKQWAKSLVKELRHFLGKKHKIVRSGADATICIGGDGTILHAYQQKNLEGAVLGIGSKRSYICQLRKDSWKKKILSALESRKIKVMSLKASVGKKQFTALNDFVVHATNYRVVEITVGIDGSCVAFEGDGLIVSSALGSAAYAYSAGGKKLSPLERKIQVVPICPYKRTFAPRVLGAESRIDVKAGSNCALITDGGHARNLKKGQTIHIKNGKEIIFFEGVGK